MLFKGNSSRLQLLIEKIQSNNKDTNDEQDIEGTFINKRTLLYCNILLILFIIIYETIDKTNFSKYIIYRIKILATRYN